MTASTATTFDRVPVERGIIFSAPMVRAILDARKLQTRRIAKPQPAFGCRFAMNGAATHALHLSNVLGRECVPVDGRSAHHRLACPYGVVGDRLWVREEHWAHGHWMRTCTSTPTGRPKHEFCRSLINAPAVRFDRPEVTVGRPKYPGDRAGPKGWVYRHARFMERRDARIALEVTDVRVQRLQDISEEDARAEGVRELPLQERQPGAWWTADVTAGSALHARTPVDAFRKLWESLHGAGSWDANPWVWALTFRRFS